MTDSAAEAGSRSSRAMTREEIDAFLRQGFWGVLATALDNEPYGVPIIYAYDDDGTFYIANGPGRKISTLEKNPNVTLTVVVIVFGKAEIVSDVGEKLHAFNALRRQLPRPAARLRDAAKLAMAKVIRIRPTEVTGKTIGY
jgi:nitroimidazol reductase NimA-like FMN-containing flavoprotein (pyridoxamine 5'-phosphate oxidase superfamily)